MRLENVFLGELENETFSKSYSHYKLKCLVWSQKTVLRHLNFLHILSICRDLDRAFRVIADLQAESCWINNYNVVPAEVPFGGYKMSGVGRELGEDSIEYYTQVKSVYVEMWRRRFI